MNLWGNLLGALLVLGILVSIALSGLLLQWLVAGVAPLFAIPQQVLETRRAQARRALEACLPYLRGRLASGTEARVEGHLRGEAVELAYLEVSKVLVVKLWTAFTTRALEFEVVDGWLGTRWSGPGSERVRGLSEGGVFADLLEEIWERGWKSLSLEGGALILRRSCDSALPPPESIRSDLLALQRIGVICETGGLLLRRVAAGVQICPFCRDELGTEAFEDACIECGTRMHLECRAENAGCVVYGCAALGIGRRRQA